MEKKDLSRKNKISQNNRHGNMNYFPKQNLNTQYRSRQIVLTISILVSGRREAIEKCIASLEHLRQRVACELILTDTGCPEEMQEWLREKADKVLKFKWCDDFAAARNVGLRAARGQWFMFMDDDEWFEDTAGLETFFLSGEYRRYQSASYIVRNYVNMEGSVWRDIHLTRMTLRRPDTRFFYPIHESLWPLLDPEKHLEDYAHHYGYASEDPEVQLAKRKRNLGILLPAIEGDPHCMKHYLQAVAEYYAMDDWDNACRMADMGIASCDPSRAENAVHIDGLYAASVRMRLRGKRNLEVIQTGRDYLEHGEISDLARASICSDLAIACGELGEYRSCWKYLGDYLNWKAYFESHREEWLKQETVVLDSCFENYQYRKAMGWGFAAALVLQDAQGAETLLGMGTLEWWLDAVQVWYTLASPQIRERWQADFQAMVESMEIRNGQESRDVSRSVSDWEQEAASYSRLRQFYGILTMPASDRQMQTVELGQSGTADAEETTALGLEQETGAGDGPVCCEESAQAAVSREIAELAVQLKEKLRVLMQQGQNQAALGIISQLQMFFPEDAELTELRRQCEKDIEI